MRGRPANLPARIALATLGACTAVFASLGALQMGAQDTPPPVTLLPLANSQNALARAAAAKGDAESAKAHTQAALAIKPADPEAWVRLASLESKGGKLSPGGRAALEHSYAVAPYHPGLLAYRLPVVFDHWSELSPDLQRQIDSELGASWRLPPLRRRLFIAAQQTRDPTGRIAIALKLFAFRMADLTERSERQAAERRSKTDTLQGGP